MKTKLFQSGAIVSSFQEDSFEYSTIYEGETSSSIVLTDYDQLSVQGGTVIRTTVDSNGILYLYYGIASDTTVKSGGMLYAMTDEDDDENSLVNGLTVMNGGSASIDGGNIKNTTIESGAYLNGFEFQSKTVFSSGLQFNNLAVSNGCQATISYDQSGNNITVRNGAILDILDGGDISNLTVESGGTINGFIQNKTVTMQSGIAVQDVVVSGYGTLWEGQSAVNVVIGCDDSYGASVVTNGHMDNVSFNGNGSLYVIGGSVNNLTMQADTTLYAFDGTLTNVNWKPLEGIVFISEEADISFTSNFTGIYHKKGNEATVSQTQCLKSATIGTSGTSDEMCVMSGGVLDTVTASNSVIHVYGGGIVSSATIASDAMLNVNSGATVKSIDLKGWMSVYGGEMNGVSIASGGNLNTFSDDVIVDNVVINNGGIMEGGVEIKKLTVQSGGSAFIGETIVSGELTIEDGGVVECYELDFDLGDRTAVDGYMINDLSAIDNLEEIYISLEVSSIGNIASGTYKLAQCAEEFDGDIYIDIDRPLGGESIEYEISVGETITTPCGVYTLNCKNGNLTVTVDISTLTPENCGNFGSKGNTFILQDDGSAVIKSSSATTAVSGKVDLSKWDLVGIGDFNKSGVDGLLWRSKADNSVYMQNNLSNFNELGKTANRLGVLEEGYEILGIGDFSGSGIEGVVMKGPAFGDASISLNYGLPVWARDSNGNTFNGWLGALVNTWQPGDELEGDKTNLADINAKNYMYDIYGVGDFNGDGVDDVLLMNIMPEYVDGVRITGAGDVFTFLTGDVEAIKAGATPTVAYAGCAVDEWEIFGVGDFNGDGIDDVLLCDDNGNVAGWKMTNGQRTENFWFGTVCEDVGVLGVTDCNGDGTDDIVFCDTENDERFAWLIKDGAVSQTIAIA